MMSLTVPIFFSAYGDLSEDLTEGVVTRSIERMISAMEDVLSGDLGSVSYLDIDLDGFGSCSMDELNIGGPLSEGVDRYLIQYSLTTGSTGKFSLDPPFPITSEDGFGLTIGGGSYRIRIRRSMDDGQDHLVVSLDE